jgi:hypothetical protein
LKKIHNNRTQEENFGTVQEILKKLTIVEIDRDIHNWTVNAKYKNEFIPPFFEWLTIVCLDKRILVNSRPAQPTIMLWLRRNAMIHFKKLLKSNDVGCSE